jgi:16S rRNA C967 or C1407 C5-methylase (RsmB/RsmF family)
VTAFLEARNDFCFVDLRTTALPVIGPFIDAHGFFRTTPPAHGLEAFFAALLIKRA